MVQLFRGTIQRANSANSCLLIPKIDSACTLYSTQDGQRDLSKALLKALIDEAEAWPSDSLMHAHQAHLFAHVASHLKAIESVLLIGKQQTVRINVEIW